MEFDPFKCELSGVNLIEASAGTGKTYSIASLYLRFVLESNLPVESILVVTFTEAATSELKDRIRKRLRECLDYLKNGSISGEDAFLESLSKLKGNAKKLAEMKLEISLRTFDRASIFTIHGFCRRILQEQAFETGSMFNFRLEPDLSDLEAEIISDFLRSRFKKDENNPESNLYESSIFLRYLVNNKFFSGSLSQFMSKIRPFPKVMVKDFHGFYDRAETINAEKKFVDSFEKAKTIWESKKTEIRTCLLESKSLNGTSYKEGIIKRLFEDIKEYLSNEIPQPVLFDDFEKLTSSFIITKTKKGQSPPEHDFFNLCEDLKIASDFLADLYITELNRIKKDFIEYYSIESEKRKNINNTLGFNDLLLKVHDAIKGPFSEKICGSLRKKFRAALIDEFQDTDHIQYDIFSTVFKNTTPLFLIGDPKQSIYGFRGADIFAYLKASEQAEKKYTLTTNWRSDGDLIQAVNSIFSNRENPFVFEGINYFNSKASKGRNNSNFEFPGIEGSLEIFAFAGKNNDSVKKPENLICEYVAERISRLISKKATISGQPVRPCDIAILVRRHIEGKRIKKLLDKAGIPSVSSGGDDVFKSVEALYISRLLSAVANISDMSRLKAALLTPFFGRNADEIADLDRDEKALDKNVLIFKDLNETWTKKDFSQMFRKAVNRHGVMASIASEPDGERTLTNLFHLAELINHQEASEKLSMDEVISWLSEKMKPETNGSEEELLRLESEADAVKIITIHKSKGLEFPIVFCPFPAKDMSRMNNESIVIHSSDDDESFTYFDVTHPDFKITQKKQRAEELAESSRLLYVALTRAKHACFIAIDTDSCCSALGYLLFHDNKLNMNDGIDDLKKGLGSTDFTEKRSRLDDLCKKSGGSIFISDYTADNWPKINNLSDHTKENLANISIRTFERRIKSGPVITSFSGLTAESHSPKINPDVPDPEEENYNLRETGSKASESKKTILDFPRGTEAGNLIHSFIESLDFKADKDAIQYLAETKLQEFGFDMEWAGIITDMATVLVSVKLQTVDSNFSLSSIKSESRINEMGFYFPIKKLLPSDLAKTFSGKCGDEENNQKLVNKLEKLNYWPISGFMRGFMDMFFEHDGLYYIVDWKSNHIGDTSESYSNERLNDIMISELYILQYHLYVVALDRYLSSRIPKYSYDKNFGGVFYLFIRGLDESGKNGIYFHKPDEAFIKKLSSDF